MTAQQKVQGDPMFAAIAEHRLLCRAWHRLSDQLDTAEFRAQKKHGQRPWSLIAWRNYSAIGGAEIEKARDEFLSLPAIDPKRILREYRDAKMRERAGKKAEIDWDKRAGLTALRRALDQAIATEEESAMKMAKTKVTAAGAAALIAYINEQIEDAPLDWHFVALANLAHGLAEMDRVSIDGRTHRRRAA